MSNQITEANQLRKNGDYESALELYRDAWNRGKYNYVGAGLLHCLRKLRRWPEALSLADTLILAYADDEWVRIEHNWTYIQGVLSSTDEEAPLDKVIEAANKIMNNEPDALQANKTVMQVLKAAGKANRFDIMETWVDHVRREQLSSEPIIIQSGKEGWSELGSWYNLKIKMLMNTGRADEALSYCNEAISRFPKQFKFFKRHQAFAYHTLGDDEKAIAAYDELANKIQPDWFILRDYATILKKVGRMDDARNMYYRAMESRQKPDMMVGLFEDIGDYHMEMADAEKALDFYMFTKMIKETNSKEITGKIMEKISRLALDNLDYSPPKSIHEAKKRCNTHRDQILREIYPERYTTSSDERVPRKDLKGTVDFGSPEWKHAFIHTNENERIICYKTQLPEGIMDRDIVVFDAIPSFDNKKNQESWKAKSIRQYQ